MKIIVLPSGTNLYTVTVTTKISVITGKILVMIIYNLGKKKKNYKKLLLLIFGQDHFMKIIAL